MPARRTATESYWLYALAGALLTGGPVWHYLFVNRYPLRPEAVLLPLVAGLIGAVIALIGHRIGGLLEGLGFGVLLYVFVDLQFDLDQTIPTLVIAGGCLVLALLLRARRALITCLTLGAFDLASLPARPAEESQPLNPETGARPATHLPLLVHLVLDEQWGIGGLRAAGDSATAGFLSEFYLERGFEVYEGAYSRSNLTRESISQLMSLGGQPAQLEPVPPEARHPSRFRLRDNPYFTRLRERGYSIRVFQTTHLDHCSAAGIAVASCETPPANSIANIGYLSGSWRIRAELAARYFLNLASHAYVRLKRPPDGPVWRRASVGRGLAELRDVRDAIARRPQAGTAFYIHVLLPHRPLSVDASCSPYADPDQQIGYEAPKHMSDSAWRVVLGRYAGQDRCVHLVLDELLTTLDRTVGRDRSIVLVHGDHGVRVSQHSADAASSASQLDPQQLNSIYSTLLAIRRPGVSPSVQREPVPIQDFLWELVRLDFNGSVTGNWRHFVHLVPPDSVPQSQDFLRALTPEEMLWVRPAP